MIRCGALLLAALAAAGPVGVQGRERLPYRDPRLPVADRVRDLLGRMTLEEKFWQLYMTPGDLDDRAHDYSHGAFGRGR
jgi:beta-glucosidase